MHSTCALPVHFIIFIAIDDEVDKTPWGELESESEEEESEEEEEEEQQQPTDTSGFVTPAERYWFLLLYCLRLQFHPMSCSQRTSNAERNIIGSSGNGDS